MLRLFALVATGLLITSSLALAQPGNKGKGPKKGNPANERSENRGWDDDTALEIFADVVFSDRERRTIGDYFRNNRVNTAALPPGIAKNYARGKPLPPGIAKKALPDGLRSRLRQRDGYSPWIIGDDVALIEEGTGLVVDVIADVLLN